MQIEDLSNAELVNRLESLARNERAVTVTVLEHLIELEARGLYRDLGYSNLFDYCTRALKYSAASAYRRIAAARCLKGNREIGDLIRDGKLTLCTVATAAKSINRELTKVEEIIGCSKREVETLVAYKEPVEIKPKETIKPISVSVAPSTVEERVNLRFSLSKQVYQRVESVKSRLSNTLGKELTLEAVLEHLVDTFLETRERKPRGFNPNSRRIPNSLKRAVYAQANNQCCYQSPDGVRCSSTKYLQVDHILPFAAGGKTEISNLRLLCPAHNRLMAERHFGREFMHSYYHR